jgi:hypothetical protein
MVSANVQAFPYTLGYLKQLFDIDETLLMSYIHTLGIQPRPDEIAGGFVFTQQDVDLIRKTLQGQLNGMTAAGNPGNAAQSPPFTNHSPTSPLEAPRAHASTAGLAARVDALQTRTLMSPGSPLPQPSGMVNPEKGFVAVLDAVSQVKEGILKDLSQLLDDKLSGLDEVIAELIKAKTDNDTLRSQMTALIEEKSMLQKQLSSYKPVQFGFYRKSPN